MSGMLCAHFDARQAVQVSSTAIISFLEKTLNAYSLCRCPGCGWPLCGSKCTGLRTDCGHSVWECSALREHRVADHLDRSGRGKELIHTYEAITPLRCLLLKHHDPQGGWAQLMAMEAHNDIRRKISSLWRRNQEVVVDRLRGLWGFKEFSEEEVHTVCGVLEVNCFEIGQNGARARALYAEAFLLAHDCSANTSHSDDPNTYEMTIRVIREVPINDPITLSYAYTLQVRIGFAPFIQRL